MKSYCEKCGREVKSEKYSFCADCFINDLIRRHPSVKRDIKFVKMPEGTFSEINIVRGLSAEDFPYLKCAYDKEGFFHYVLVGAVVRGHSTYPRT